MITSTNPELYDRVESSLQSGDFYESDKYSLIFPKDFSEGDIIKEKIVLFSVLKRNGYALEYAEEPFKKEKDVVLIAVKNSGQAL